MKLNHYQTYIKPLSYLAVLLCTLVFTACNNDDSSRNLVDEEEDFDDLKPFSTTATYSAVITNCAKADKASEYCNLATLPLLGQEVADITVPDIMNRLVISHDWMANNFEEILYLLPPEILPLFKGLTAIVIDDDIRPAFYTTSTGAIYLDPAYLWVTVAEKSTINLKEDYRAGFDDALVFNALGFYTSGNNYAFNFGSLTDNNSRQIEDAMYTLARLLLHELAHVNDFIPPSSYAGLDTSMTVSEVATSLTAQRPSNVLKTTYPLTSQLHIDLAQVMYFGDVATTAQRTISAQEAGLAFEPDGASDHYGYSNQFEDAAMLFEAALMKQFFDFDYDVSFVDTPANPSACDDYVVRWGEFNRIGDTNVKARAQYIIGELLPDLDTTMFFQNLAGPTWMTNGISWCENLANKTVTTTTISKSGTETESLRRIPLEQLRRPYL